MIKRITLYLSDLAKEDWNYSMHIDSFMSILKLKYENTINTSVEINDISKCIAYFKVNDELIKLEYNYAKKTIEYYFEHTDDVTYFLKELLVLYEYMAEKFVHEVYVKPTYEPHKIKINMVISNE